MLKHTVTHRSSSSLSGSSQPSSLPYQLQQFQNEPAFQTRRGSLSSSVKSQPSMSSYPRRSSESSNCFLPTNKQQSDKSRTVSDAANSKKDSIIPLSIRTDQLKRKVSGSRSFVELVNLLDAHPSLVDMDLDDSCSEASFSSIESSASSIGYKSLRPTYDYNSFTECTLVPDRSSTLPRNNESLRPVPLHNVGSFSSIDSCTSCSSLNSSKTIVNSNSPSMTSLAETIPVKVYIRRLRPDMEYKTLPLSSATTCREMILSLLVKFRLRHRDPNLFFVMMEVTVRSPSDSAPAKRILVLDDNARPAELQQCRPTGEARFSIGVRRGGLIRVHDSILMPGSQYKSLIISYGTTSDELILLLLKCYNNGENPKHFALHEVCKNPYTDKPLRGDDCPLMVQVNWPKLDRFNRSFVLRRNIAYSFSLKSKMKWRQSLEQSTTDTESETDCQNRTRSSLHSTASSVSVAPRSYTFSSSGSVSSNCSTSSDSSLDSGYLGSPLSSFKLPSSGPSVVCKSVRSYVKPCMPLDGHQISSSIPMTQTLSRLAGTLEIRTNVGVPINEIYPQPKNASIRFTDPDRNAPQSLPIPRRKIASIKPINLKQLPEFSHMKHKEQAQIIKTKDGLERLRDTNYTNVNSTKPRIVGEIPKESDISKLRRQLSESLQCHNQSSPDSKLSKSFPPPPPSSPRIVRTSLFISKWENSSFMNAERKFYEAVESLKTIGSTQHYKSNELQIVE